MEQEKKTIINDNGSYTEIVKTTTNKDDGLVHQADINEANPNNYGKFKKGYSKSVSITTNDPNITRIVSVGFFMLFLLIGFICLFVAHAYIFGIIFVATAILCFVKTTQDINKIDKELKDENNTKK